MNFVAFAANQGLKHQTIKCYLSACNPSPPDRVRRGRPENGNYATSSLAWDQAGASGIREAHPAANHPGYTGAVAKGMESRSFQPRPCYVVGCVLCRVLWVPKIRPPEVGEFDPGQHLSFADITVDDIENLWSVAGALGVAIGSQPSYPSGMPVA